MKKYWFILAIALLILGACSKDNKVSGTIEGADEGTKLRLEHAVNGNWVPIDSTETNKDGEFGFSFDDPKYPDVYRLMYNGEYIYFPIDSTERITIKANVKDFATNYTLEGSEHAKQMMEFDQAAVKMMSGNTSPQELAAWKKELANLILDDPKSIVAYYIVHKRVNNRYVFDRNDDFDFKILGAVVNAYHDFLPDDPRTKYISETYVEAQRQRRIQSGTFRTDTIMADDYRIFEGMVFTDQRNHQQDLDKIAHSGNVTLLSFTIYTAQFSPALTQILNDIYSLYHDKGLEIYQVSYDNSALAWQHAALNLPWISVYDSEEKTVMRFNVMQVPTVFIVDRNGVIRERVENEALGELKSIVAKYM